jgi:drug/metabolite transporter (DMT)-like permease
MPAPAGGSMSLREWLLLIALSGLWGGSFFFAKIAVAALPPLTLVLLRVGIAALALSAVMAASGRRWPWEARAWRALLVMGAINNVIPFSLVFWGQTHIASGLAAILNATTPLFTALLAHWLTRDEPLTARRVAGVLLGLGGVVDIVGPQALAGVDTHVLAALACLGAAVAYAGAGIFGRRLAGLGLTPMAAAAGQLGASTLIMLPIVLVHDRPWTLPAPNGAIIGAVVALALASTALAYVIYFRLLATAGAVNLLLVTLLIPVSALFLGAAFLDERPAAEQWAGMALIALGLAAIDGRPFAALTRRHSDSI